jgi:hypothetical protein
MNSADIAKSAVLLAMVLAGSGLAQAEAVYKWTDQRGVVNYSTTPPPAGQRASTVDTSSSVGLPADASEEEVRAWREKRERELARDKRELESMRRSREAEQARTEQYRQQLAMADRANQSAEARRQAAREQCLRERRVDCDTATSQFSTTQGATTVIARRPRQTIQQASPFPVTNPTSGPAPGTTAGTQAQLAPFRAATPAPNPPASLKTRQ